MDASVIASIVNAGPTGIALFIAWKLLEQIRGDRAELMTVLKEINANNAKLATALTVLALKITGRPPDGDAS